MWPRRCSSSWRAKPPGCAKPKTWCWAAGFIARPALSPPALCAENCAANGANRRLFKCNKSLPPMRPGAGSLPCSTKASNNSIKPTATRSSCDSFKTNLCDAVGAALGISEEAARKRVSRSLEKLRAFFVRRGFTISTAALASALAGTSCRSRPRRSGRRHRDKSTGSRGLLHRNVACPCGRNSRWPGIGRW